MSNRKNSKLKRHPLVRFVRGVLRLLKIIFKPKQRRLESQSGDLGDRDANLLSKSQLDSRHRQEEIDNVAALAAQIEESNRLAKERSLTVSELFARVKWQTPEVTTIQEMVPDNSLTRTPDYSRN